MADEGVSFPAAMGEESISTHMTTIVNTLWYLDGNKDTLTERAKHSKDVKPLSNRYKYNMQDLAPSMYDKTFPCSTLQSMKSKLLLTLYSIDTHFDVSTRQLLKTLWEKEKLLVTSNFSFSHNV